MQVVNNLKYFQLVFIINVIELRTSDKQNVVLVVPLRSWELCFAITVSDDVESVISITHISCLPLRS